MNLSSKSISIKGKGYKNNVISLILNRNYDENELPYLIEEYERFNIEIKSKINNIVIENIDTLKTNLNIASKHLVLDILNSVYTEMNYEDKVQMFIETFQLFNQEEITDLFETLNLEEYVDFFDFKKRRNMVFEINELNRSILESLKSADLITDYNPIKDKNYYSMKRKKKNKIR